MTSRPLRRCGTARSRLFQRLLLHALTVESVWGSVSRVIIAFMPGTQHATTSTR